MPGLRPRRAGDQTQAAHIDALVLGSALALEVTGAVGDMREGVARARRAIADGSATRWLADLEAWQPAS